MTHPADALAAAIASAGSPVCVGLDPVYESLPADLRARHHEPLAAISEFCHAALRAAAPAAGVFKPQSACFERHGHRGVALLEELIAEALRLNKVIVLDAKRGDIGSTAAHYAASVKRMGVHWVTVNGYLGMSGIEPFLDAGLGVFVLVRTSNPDSDEVQNARLQSGETVGEAMAARVAALGAKYRSSSGLSAAGAVVGVTKPQDGQAMRSRMPDQWFLMPGYGAQGGTAADIRAMLRPAASADPSKCGVLVNASRSVLYPKAPEGQPQHQSWQEAVAAAAKAFNHDIRAALA